MSVGFSGKISPGSTFSALCSELGVDMDSSVLSLIRGASSEPVMSNEWGDRALASFIGLACGDAFGRPLEFISSDRVYSREVDVRHFMWTDDTHMSLYLADAICDARWRLSEDGPPIDVLGNAIGRHFVEWLNDPETPSTAPGATCMGGARRFQSCGDWSESGDKGSDGCGAVMRVLPIAIAYSGWDLIQASQVSAAVTHAHPNAIESTLALALMVRWTLADGRFNEGTVKRTIKWMNGWKAGTTIVRSLEAALLEGSRLAARPHELVPIDEQSIPDGDGGWRSPSAVGIAVAAVLSQVEHSNFEGAIVRAARIKGDSDSTGAIAGMIAGAAGWEIPAEWELSLPRYAEICEAASNLIDFAREVNGDWVSG